MTDVRTEVKLYLEQHEPEGLAYIDCPECGNTDKLMLIPLDDGGTFYKCLRASCPTAGSIGSTYTATTKRETPTQTRRTYDPYTKIPDVRLEPTRRFAKYSNERLCAGMYTDSYGNKRYIFPIRDRMSREVGYVGRTYQSDEFKALVRPYFTSGSLLAWYRPQQIELRSNIVVLVEDQISAAMIARSGLVSVALLGTTIGYHDETELRNKRTVTVLDNDALANGRLLSRKLGGAFWPLSGADVKDLDEEDYARFIDNVSTL